MSTDRSARRGRRGIALSIVVGLLALILIVPLVPYAVADKGPVGVPPNPGTQLWRDFRAAVAGTTQARGVDAGVLINDAGQEWRDYRVRRLVPYSAFVLGGMVGLFALYFLIRGRIRVEDGPSGKVIERSTRAERWIHWYIAVVFSVLGLTGLILLYGRWVLIPLLGPEGFSVTALVCKSVHNYGGLLFVLAVPLAFFAFLKDSLFKLRVDLGWFLRAGGYLGGPHPHSEKLNAGQKSWYWLAMITGVVLCVTGLILDFPNFEQGRELMQDAHLLHTVAAIAVLAFFVVHLYLATVGVQGAFQAMTSGYVDANWARQHHDLWYAQAERDGKVMDEAEAAGVNLPPQREGPS